VEGRRRGPREAAVVVKRLVCWVRRSHDTVGVVEAGAVARPGGMLPALDGYTAYAVPEDPGDATHRACRRCGVVLDGGPRG
jgi:hypothetical protein